MALSILTTTSLSLVVWATNQLKNAHSMATVTRSNVLCKRHCYTRTISIQSYSSLMVIFVFWHKTRFIESVRFYFKVKEHKNTRCCCLYRFADYTMFLFHFKWQFEHVEEATRKKVVVVSLRCGSKFKKYLTLDQRWSELFENGTKTEKN